MLVAAYGVFSLRSLSTVVAFHSYRNQFNMIWFPRRVHTLSLDDGKLTSFPRL